MNRRTSLLTGIIAATLTVQSAAFAATELDSAATKEAPGGINAAAGRAVITGALPSQTATSPPSPQPSKDSVNQEVDDAKRQLETSLPADAPSTPLPETGRVVSSPKEKQKAASESIAVNSHGAQPTIPARTKDGRPTVALALGGGGARGGAHVGVLRVLEREGIPIDYVVGNSMGAIVGGMYASGLDLDRISEVLSDGSLKHAYAAGPLPPKILIAPMEKLFNPFSNHYAGLYSGKRFTKFLDKTLPTENMNIQDTKIPFSVVATNLLDGKAYRLSEGRMSTAIKASSALSPILRPVPIGDKLYVDGGVRANLPAKAARETGAGIVLAVLVDEPLGKVPPSRFKHLRAIGSRLVDIVLATADERQLQFADVVINPNVSGIGILSKKREDVEKAIHAGELAAEKALPAIREALAHPKQSSVAASSSEPQAQ